LIDPNHGDPDRKVRKLVGDITGVPLGPTSAVGAALGLLTIDQALALAEKAEAITTRTAETTNQATKEQHQP
jgi:hypothetical protein